MLKKIMPVVLLLLVNSSFATSNDTSGMVHKAVLGYNIGAVTPVGLPENIRKVYSYSPAFSPSFGYEGIYILKKKWMFGFGLRVDFKGMSIKDSVAYLPTIIRSGNDQFEGSFSGKNHTKVQNIYLTLPVYLQFTPGIKWRYKLGIYIACLLHPRFEGTVSDGYIRNDGSLGERVDISSAGFDFDDKEQRFDMGIHAGIEHDISKKWALTTQLQWGLIPVFPASFNGISFKMYNIFGNIGVSYKL